MGEEATDLIDGGGEASTYSEDIPAGNQVVAVAEDVRILVGDGGEGVEGRGADCRGIPTEIQVLC